MRVFFRPVNVTTMIERTTLIQTFRGMGYDASFYSANMNRLPIRDDNLNLILYRLLCPGEQRDRLMHWHAKHRVDLEAILWPVETPTEATSHSRVIDGRQVHVALTPGVKGDASDHSSLDFLNEQIKRDLVAIYNRVLAA